MFWRKKYQQRNSVEEEEILKTEDLNIKEPVSSIKKRETAEDELLKMSQENQEQVEPFDFSQDTNSEEEKQHSVEIIQNLDTNNNIQEDVSILSKSKSEAWGGKCYGDYYGSDDEIQPMKLHYTEGDLSNIELVEEDSEGEESEPSQITGQDIDVDSEFSNRIIIAE